MTIASVAAISSLSSIFIVNHSTVGIHGADDKVADRSWKRRV
jgi:hypothetical protein